MRLIKSLFLLIVICAQARAAKPLPIPSADELVNRLEKSHPRLLASSNDFVHLRESIKTDPTLEKWSKKLLSDADKMLSEEPSKYELLDGVRLLFISRRTVTRVYTLSMAYRLTGDARYADRTWTELKATGDFADWHPKHFLDTAEMAHAFAIGYDWLYDHWTPEQRTFLRDAMVKKGIEPALKIHRKKEAWAMTAFNWNQVCNGGIGMAALAIADEEPQEAGEFLEDALNSIQRAMATYAPDGAWPEGPGYWGYATEYNVVLLAALQSSLHTDFGLSKLPGFSDAGFFPIYMMGPLGKSFNFADAHERVGAMPELFWLARRFKQPAMAAFEFPLSDGQAWDLLWYQKSDPTVIGKLPLDKYFRHAEVASFRGAWNDRNASFIGFKAGSAKINHSHLDLGSFVFDAQGERWADDLASDNYNLPAYFGNQRWTYYRLRAEGHNTLVLNPQAGPDQDLAAETKIVRFQSKPDKAFAITDLSAAYKDSARNVQRGIALLHRKDLLVQDEVHCEKPADLWWFMHTPAKIELDGATARLKIGRKQMVAKILSPADAVFSKMKDEPLPSSPHPAGQANDSAREKLTVHLPSVKDLQLSIIFSTEEDMPRPVLQPLAHW